MTGITKEKKAEIDHVVERIIDRVVPFSLNEKKIIIHEFKIKFLEHLHKAYDEKQVAEVVDILH